MKLIKTARFPAIALVLFSCGVQSEISEKKLLQEKIDAFHFLSKYHHQLLIMIGEEEGEIQIAYEEIYSAIMKMDNNELKPVKNAILKIQDLNPEAVHIKRLDYLVDYYQSGLSLQIEGILRGHGYLETFSIENALDIYDKIITK